MINNFNLKIVLIEKLCKFVHFSVSCYVFTHLKKQIKIVILNSLI